MHSRTPLTSRDTRFQTTYMGLVEIKVEFPDHRGTQFFHAISSTDYVSVFALTDELEVALVRQFRPAIDAYSLELPAGLVEHSETPIEAARRELCEEAGLVSSDWVELGSGYVDTGRMTNRMHSFLATNAKRDQTCAKFDASGEGIVLEFKPFTSFLHEGGSGEVELWGHRATIMLALEKIEKETKL